MVQVNSKSGPAGSPREPRTLKGAAGFSGSMTAPVSPNSGFSGFSGFLGQAACNPDHGEQEACKPDATMLKLARLADAALRRLSPADRAAVFAECRGEA